MNYLIKYLLTIIIFLASVASSCFAMTEFKGIDQLNNQMNRSFKKLLVHPFGSNRKSFSLTDSSFNDPTQSKKDILSFLQDRGLPHMISLEEISDNNLYTRSSGTQNIKRFRFTFQGIKLCNFQIKVISLPNNQWVISGEIPQLSPSQDINTSEWNTLALSNTSIESLFQSLGSVKVYNAQKCWYHDSNKLQPALEVKSIIGHLPYRAIANSERVFSISPEFFFSSGHVKSYVKNPADGEVHETTFDDFSDDGYMTNTFFTTDTNSQERAFSESHEFIYDTSDVKFAEANVFVHANEMYSFYQSLGFQTDNAPVIKLDIHALIDGDSNNALCLPNGEGSESSPIIKVGDGDGEILKNLTLDSDVVSHELGHYIIYQTLDTASGEALVLHEGLADFFTMAKTDDQCLGESICPDESLACYVKNSCLRSADNTLQYKSEEYKDLASHLRGQLVSGLLWDIIEKSSEKDDITKLAFKAVTLLKSNDNFDDFFVALFSADTSLHEKKYYEIIKSVGSDRGFSDLTDDIDCTFVEEPPPEETEASKDTTVTSTQISTNDDDSGKKKFIKCGTISNVSTPTGCFSFLLLNVIVLLIPIVISIRKKSSSLP